MVEPADEVTENKVGTELFVPELRDYLIKKSQLDLFSGVALVAKEGQPIVEYVSGTANRDRGVPNTLETKFNLGSANKMFTAVAVAQLVEKGLLSFDDPIGKLLPDYPNSTVKNEVTIHNLLTHTAGMGSFIDTQFREQLLAAREGLKSINDVVALFKDRPLPYKVGEYNYSSDGYEVLGAVIEAVSGQSYYDYVRDNIFRVAGMADTDSFEIDPKNVRGDVAIGYTHRDPVTDKELDGERIDNLRVNLLKGTAGGSGYSTCYDLLKFSQALLSHKLLSPEMTELVLSPKVKEGTKGNQTKYYGYGFQIFDIDGVRRIGHPGRFAGVNARFDMYPDLGYTVVVLSNYDPPAAFDVAEKATELITTKV